MARFNMRVRSRDLAALGLVLGISLVVSCRNDERREAEDAVLVVSWGGQFQQDLVDLWLQPAADSCDVEIATQSWNGDYGALSSQIEKGINIWDLVHVEGHYVASPRADSLFQSYPDRELEGVNPNLVRDNAVPVLEYGYALAYRRDLVEGPRPIEDWEDFWNEEDWPGRRGLRDFPVGNIEIALLSLGRDPRTVLYADDLTEAEISTEVDRAIQRITELEDVEWWTSGDQLERLITTGATPVVAAWSGRLWAAHKTLCQSESVEACALSTVTNQILTGTDWWVIPANASRGNQANKLLQCLFTWGEQERALAFAKKQGYTVPLEDAGISDPVGNFYLQLGTSGSERIHLDEEFWGEHFESINRRWLGMRV